MKALPMFCFCTWTAVGIEDPRTITATHSPSPTPSSSSFISNVTLHPSKHSNIMSCSPWCRAPPTTTTLAKRLCINICTLLVFVFEESICSNQHLGGRGLRPKHQPRLSAHLRSEVEIFWEKIHIKLAAGAMLVFSLQCFYIQTG